MRSVGGTIGTKVQHFFEIKTIFRKKITINQMRGFSALIYSALRHSHLPIFNSQFKISDIHRHMSTYIDSTDYQ